MARDTRSKTISRKKDVRMDGSFPLAEEVHTYEANLAGWLDREGPFFLIKGDAVLGFYPSWEKALEAGYHQVEDGPFLAKQILQYEPIDNLGNVNL